MSPTLIAIVAATGAVGALARYGAERVQWHVRDARARRRPAAGPVRVTMPWATVVVNVLGSALLGWVAAARGLPVAATAALGSGFAGAFTTFSTFSVDAYALVRGRRWGLAAAYLALSLGLGAAAAYAGHALAG